MLSMPVFLSLLLLGALSIAAAEPPTAEISNGKIRARLYLPNAVNGTSVTIGGITAPILAVGVEPRNNPSTYIVAQVPVNVALGSQPVVVKTANGTSAAKNVTVAAQAPALFFDGQGAIVARATTLELVRPSSPARAGEALAIISTGLGQTVPALATMASPTLPTQFEVASSKLAPESISSL